MADIFLNWEDVDFNWESIQTQEGNHELLNWENVDLMWVDMNMNWEYIEDYSHLMNWEDIRLIEEVASIVRGGGSSYYEDYVKNNPWKRLNEEIGEEKTDKFIKIYCNVNGMDYEKEIQLSEGITVSVEKFEKIFETIKVKVDVKK